MNFFDSIRDNSVRIVNDTMGYDAVWTPQGDFSGDFSADFNGGVARKARVLFSNATEKDHDLDNEVFETFDCKAEFLLPDFAGLMESSGNKKKEIITINLESRGEGIQSFYVVHVAGKWDGKTHIAYLIRKKN